MASSNSREWRAVCEKFRRAQDLSEIESRKDPENDPFRSKYKARDLLKDIYCTVKNFEVDDSENEDREPDGQSGDPGDGEGINAGASKAHTGDSPAGLRASRHGVIDYYLGVNHLETEELSAGEEYLMNCMKLLEDCTVTRENVSLFIQVRNQLGILWAGRDETEKAQGFLETAESIYVHYMREVMQCFHFNSLLQHPNIQIEEMDSSDLHGP